MSQQEEQLATERKMKQMEQTFMHEVLTHAMAAQVSALERQTFIAVLEKFHHIGYDVEITIKTRHQNNRVEEETRT